MRKYQIPLASSTLVVSNESLGGLDSYDRLADWPAFAQYLAAHYTEVVERQFPDWSLGFKSLDADDIPPESGYNPFLELHDSTEESSWSGSVAKCLLATFKLRTNEALSTGQPAFTPDPRLPRY